MGVDIFFVVSGFLVGGPLVEEALATGRIRWREFYVRRIWRILPAGTLVALVSLAVAGFIASPLALTLTGPNWDQPTISRDGIAAGLSAVNLWYAVQASGYNVVDPMSPFTHFWSLGVEEQFYAVAPLAALGVVAIARRRRKDALLLVGVLVVWGFIYGTAAPWFYSLDGFFDPVARAWELGAGVAIALTIPRLRGLTIGTHTTTVLTALGWLALAVAVAIVTMPDDWPGPATLAPVGATMALLALGALREPGRVASHRWTQWLGDRSFSIYLWHWPLLVVMTESGPLHGSTSVAVLVSTLILSAVTYKWVELPARAKWRARGSRIAALMVLVGSASIVSASIALGVVSHQQLIATGQIATPYVARHVATEPAQMPAAVPVNLTPALERAAQDGSSSRREGCMADVTIDASPHTCTYGSNGPVVALFGDSHADMWVDALRGSAERGEFQLVVVAASGCPPIDLPNLEHNDGCREWRESSLTIIDAMNPELTVMSMRTTFEEVTHDEMLDAIKTEVQPLTARIAGPVAWIADVPKFSQMAPECASESMDDTSACAEPRAQALPQAQNDALRQSITAAGAIWIDLTDYLCDEELCPIILGDTLMYWDDDHITGTFSRALSPALADRVRALASVQK